MGTIIAIDVSNFAYKEYFGSGGNVAQSIVKKARGALCKIPDSHVYLAYDCEGKTFRHAIFEGYKAGRDDDEHKRRIMQAIQESKILAHNAGLHVIQIEQYEADDILASLARQGRVRGESVMLVSEDKDLYTLLQYDGVKLFKFISAMGHDPDFGTLVKFVNEVTEEDVFNKYGVEPFQWMDYRCMTGDSSDKIKGLNGYGPKRAAMILDTFDSLQDMFDNWEEHREGFKDKDAKKFDDFRQELPKLRRLFHMVDSLDVIRHGTTTQGTADEFPDVF